MALDMSQIVDKTFKTLEDVFNAIRHFEIQTTTRYVTGKSSKNFGKIDLDISGRKKILWMLNVPYVSLGQKILYCHHGKDHHHKSKARKKEHSDHSSYAKGSRFLSQHTKKLGCEAKVIVTEILMFSQNESPQGKTEKDKVAKTLHREIIEGKSSGEKCFIVKFPTIEEHSNHPTGELAGLTDSIDPLLKEKIKELCEEGVTSIEEMRRHLQVYVKGMSLTNHMYNKRFNPTDKTIRNHMYMYQRKSSLQQNDQENVDIFVKNWKNDHPEDVLFYRMKEDTAEDSRPNKFLFVYQSQWMKRILERYGGHLILLDATYRTSKFSLPLFFLAVKTNVNYQVAACFLTEDEQSETITEALQILKQTNPNWSPQYGMTDFDEQEMTALESVFPGMHVFICSFHREQAWERWLKRTKNQIDDKEGALSDLRDIANATKNEEFVNLVEKFQMSSHSDKLKAYFSKVWLPVKERWASCFRSSLQFNINTNNGLERQHQIFKTQYLKNKTRQTLIITIKTLLQRFFPDRQQSYTELNQSLARGYRQYNKEVPDFLQEKPRHFVKHCMEKIELSSEIHPDSIEQLDEFNYKVDRGYAIYKVCLGNDNTLPACDCRDWQRNLMPCKHMFAIMRNGDLFNWEMLSSRFRSTPQLNIDLEVAGFRRPSQKTKSLQDNDKACNALIKDEPVFVPAVDEKDKT